MMPILCLSTICYILSRWKGPQTAMLRNCTMPILFKIFLGPKNETPSSSIYKKHSLAFSMRRPNFLDSFRDFFTYLSLLKLDTYLIASRIISMHDPLRFIHFFAKWKIWRLCKNHSLSSSRVCLVKIRLLSSDWSSALVCLIYYITSSFLVCWV